MKSLAIVIDLDVVVKHVTCICTVQAREEMGKLLLHAPEEAFEYGIVPAVPFSTHTRLDPVSFEYLLKPGT